MKGGVGVLHGAPLRCPVCGQALTLSGRAMECPGRHSFDIARQGYVNLTAGRQSPAADTAEMVASRADFLARGHYRPLAELVAVKAAQAAPPPGSPAAQRRLVLDVGGGTGYYLAHVLDRLDDATGLVLDTSVAALRRAARAHPRAGAVGWDVWRPWPIPSGSADVVLDVFAPRNGAEFHRVLRPDGGLVLVVPDPDHLAELRERAPLLSVDPRKQQRLHATLRDRFIEADREPLRFEMRLTAADITHLVSMGPSAYHLRSVPPELLPAEGGTVSVTASFVVMVHRPRPAVAVPPH